MNTRSLSHRILMIFGICVALAAPLSAQATIYFVGDGYAQGSETFNLTAPPPPIAVVPTPAGGFTGRIGLSNPPTTQIFFWCAELSQTFQFGHVYTDYTVLPLVNTILSQLFTEVGGSAGVLVGPASEAQTDLSAAFQLAVWEVLFEGGTYGGLNVSTGNFQATGDHDGDAVAQANIWLAALNVNSPATTALFLIHSTTEQDFITDTPIPPSLLVPEPSPLTLLGAGLIVFFFAMRRRAN
jgi:hypothetical protein